MLRIEVIIGNATLRNNIEKNCVRPEIGKDLDSGDFDYVLTTGQGSWAILTCEGKTIALRPNSRIRLSNRPDTQRQKSGGHETKIIIGKIWAKVVGIFGERPEEYQGNAAPGVRG